MINREEKIKCGWCSEVNTLGKWDDITFSKCANRKMKRAYTHLTDEKVFVNNSNDQANSFYICPSCQKWSRAVQLSFVETASERLKGLGGKSVFLNKYSSEDN